MIPYTDLIAIPVEENHDPMHNLSDHGLSTDLKYSKLDPSTGDSLYLRKAVCERLLKAEDHLQKIHPNYQLVSVYAYRSLDIQRSSFQKIKQELGLEGRDDSEANEQVHHYIAVPEVSGHPTGGAVDILIADQGGVSLDFGTPIHSMQEESQVFHTEISAKARENRDLLRAVMKDSGFAPYDGEWWHFSYGDREWAAYYKEPNAIYSQINKVQKIEE